MVRLISYILVGVVCWGFSDEPKTVPSTLSIEFTDVRNTDGTLYIFIYNYQNQYPDNPYKHFEIDKRHVNCNRLLVNIPDMVKGKYAISILDDENANEDMDFFFGIPTEGYAFSNNVRPILSMPDYEDILFDFQGENKLLKLKMRYIL
jgi:uncharacterized protein (DUF2141 family)